MDTAFNFYFIPYHKRDIWNPEVVTGSLLLEVSIKQRLLKTEQTEKT